jgi:hypothetical protein
MIVEYSYLILHVLFLPVLLSSLLCNMAPSLFINKIYTFLARGLPGKGANRALFFGAENGNAQMAKNRAGCLFRPPFLWFISFGGAKEMNIKQKEIGPFFIFVSYKFHEKL